MALTDPEFQQRLEYIGHRVDALTAAGESGDKTELFLFILQEDWDILRNPTAMETYSNVQQLAKLIALRDDQDTERPGLDAEIARLQALPGVGG